MNVASLLAKIGFSVDKAPLEGVEKQLETIKSGLEVLGAAELVHKIYEMAESFGHFAEELGISATAAGITVESLQKLQYSAGLAGVGAEEVSHGMGKLTRTLSEARSGSAEAVAAFAALGINADKLKTFKTSREALLAVSDGMHGLSDSIQRQDLAFKLFGRGAVNMVEWLSMGRSGMEAQGDAAERLGAVIDGGTIESLRDLEDAMHSMFTTLHAVAASIIGFMAPSLKLLANAIQETVARYSGLFKIKIENWGRKAAFVFGYIIGVVEALIAKFVRFAQEHPVLVEAAAKYGLVLFGLAAVFGTLGVAAKAAGLAFGLVQSGLGALGLPIRAVWGGLGIVKGVMGYILLGLGRLVTFLFPALGRWITTIGARLLFSPLGIVLAQIVGIAAAVTAVGIAAYTAWEIFKGKSFDETWLGQLWAKKGKLLDSIKGFLGFGDAQAEQAESGVSPLLQGAAALGGGNEFLDTLRRSPIKNSFVGNAEAEAAAGNVFNFKNDVTINATGGDQQSQIRRSVEDLFKQQMDMMKRQTARSINSNRGT